MESIRGYLDDLDCIYDMGILGGVKSRRRLQLRVCIAIFFPCVSMFVAFFLWV